MGVIYMSINSGETTLPSEDYSFSDIVYSFPDTSGSEVSIDFNDISTINSSNSSDTNHSIEVSNNNSNLFLSVLSGLNEATSMVHNNVSMSLGNSLNNSLGGPLLIGDLDISSYHNQTSVEEEPTFEESSNLQNVTLLGGKKVKKTALDELIKDMNRITYILKGMKVERKVINKKSKKNKNKKKNKRTYKKIKRIPRNNRKRSVKKSKK